MNVQLPFIVRQLIIGDGGRRRLDYRTENFFKVNVCGVECESNDMWIERDSVLEREYQYGAADDDESGGEPARAKLGVLVNSFGTLVCDK